MSDMPEEVFVQRVKSRKGDEYSMSPCAINPETMLGSMVEQRYIRADLTEAKQAPVDVEELTREICDEWSEHYTRWQECPDICSDVVSLTLEYITRRGLLNPDTEALKRENERLRKALEIANETFTMLWDKVPPFELPFEKQIRDAGLAVEKALATTKRGGE